MTWEREESPGSGVQDSGDGERRPGMAAVPIWERNKSHCRSELGLRDL